MTCNLRHPMRLRHPVPLVVFLFFREVGLEKRGWRRDIGCLIFTGYCLQMSRIISCSFTERDLQHKASCFSSPTFTTKCRDIFRASVYIPEARDWRLICKALLRRRILRARCGNLRLCCGNTRLFWKILGFLAKTHVSSQRAAKDIPLKMKSQVCTTKVSTPQKFWVSSSLQTQVSRSLFGERTVIEYSVLIPSNPLVTCGNGRSFPS